MRLKDGMRKNNKREKKCDKVISKLPRSEKKPTKIFFLQFLVFLFHCISIYTDLNTRYVHGLFNEFKLLLCIY